MPDPAPRRRTSAMVLDRQRKVLDFLVVPLARMLRHANPNHLTLVGLLAALPAAWLFWRSSPADEPGSYALVFAAGFVLIHGLLDLLDGVVARTYHKATPLGDFLDHVVDRVADVFLLLAVAFSPWADLRVGIAALVATLLTSYLGTQAQAVGAGRIYTGFLARADRIVLLSAAPLIDHVLAARGTRLGWFVGGEYALGVALWIIALGGFVTALERFVRIYGFLARQEQRTR